MIKSVRVAPAVLHERKKIISLAGNNSVKTFLLLTLGTLFHAILGYCQSTPELIGQVTRIYTGSDGSTNSLLGGYSIGGLVGGFLFGSIGFVAFIYGKKNSEFRPLIIGIILMAYPYFVKATLALYLIGISLTAALYFLRE